MNEKEFEEFKGNIREARKNRLYCYWRNMETGMDCKAMGPQSQCFCGHRYKEHFVDNIGTRQIYCRATGANCKCKMFDYIPVCKYSPPITIVCIPQLAPKTSSVAAASTPVTSITQME